MSAAQPVEGEGTPAAALGTRRGKLAKRRYSVAGIPRVPGFDGQEERLTALADDIEISLNTVGYTLSDDDTAAVYRHTLGVVDHMLLGAEKMGIVNGAQREELAVLLAGLRDASRFV